MYQVGQDPDHFRAFVRMQRVQLGSPVLLRSRPHRIARGRRKIYSGFLVFIHDVSKFIRYDYQIVRYGC